MIVIIVVVIVIIVVVFLIDPPQILNVIQYRLEIVIGSSDEDRCFAALPYPVCVYFNVFEVFVSVVRVFLEL